MKLFVQHVRNPQNTSDPWSEKATPTKSLRKIHEELLIPEKRDNDRTPRTMGRREQEKQKVFVRSYMTVAKDTLTTP